MQTVQDNQMLDAHSFIMGMVHAQLGLPPLRDEPTYIDSYADEYEEGEKVDGIINDLPF